MIIYQQLASADKVLFVADDAHKVWNRVIDRKFRFACFSSTCLTRKMGMHPSFA